MTRVEVRSLLRVSKGEFLPLDDVSRLTGDCAYVPGAISLVVDGVELLGVDLWDDVNWLWPFLVQALEECRQTGFGHRAFPDQPVVVTARSVRPGHVLVKVNAGDAPGRAAVVPEWDLFTAVARGGLAFEAQFRRVCSGEGLGPEACTILENWLSSRR